MRVVPLLLLFMNLCATVSTAQSFNFVPIALQGQPVPRGGGTFWVLDAPAINDSGVVAFMAVIAGAPAKQGLFIFANGVVSTIALYGEDASGGGKFGTFSNPVINSKGDVAFVSNLSIFLYSRGIVSRIGYVLGIDHGLSLNDAGVVAFAQDYREDPSAQRRQIAIYQISDGKTSVIIPPDTRGPVINNRGEIAFIRLFYEGGPISFFRDAGPGLFSNGQIIPILSPSGVSWAQDINDSGEVAFTVWQNVPPKSTLCLYQNGSTSIISVAVNPPYSAPDINNFGSIAVAEGDRMILNSATPYSTLVLYDRGRFLRMTDIPASGTGGGKLSGFGQPTLNNLGVIAVNAAITGGNSTNGIFLAVPARSEKLYFAQFGDGAQGNVSINSQIKLMNLESAAVSVLVEINDDSGSPLNVDLNGEVVAGQKELILPPDGSVTLRTDGLGPVQAGSVVVSSDRKISGVILFAGNAGTAGVGDSKPLKKFVAPMETSPGINTGVALMGLGQDQTIQLELRDEQGNLVGKGSVNLGARSHLAKFITELRWDTPPNFSSFSGTLTATGTGQFSATVIRVSPGQFTTLPVAEKN